MRFELDRFIDDFICGGSQVGKYDARLPITLSIASVVERIAARNLETSVLENYRGYEGKSVLDGARIIRDGDCYRVFVGERGIEHGARVFSSFASACARLLDLTFTSLMHPAPDSKIN